MMAVNSCLIFAGMGAFFVHADRLGEVLMVMALFWTIPVAIAIGFAGEPDDGRL